MNENTPASRDGSPPSTRPGHCAISRVAIHASPQRSDGNHMMPTNSKRAALACRVTITAPTYPGYPDPTRPTGWADIPAVILAADLSGREDIEYTAMLNCAIIPVDYATLAISEPNDDTRLWLLGLHFDNGLADIDLVSLADTETITMFSQAELLLVTTEARMNNSVDNQAAALILVSNDPRRWAETERSERSRSGGGSRFDVQIRGRPVRTRLAARATSPVDSRSAPAARTRCTSASLAASLPWTTLPSWWSRSVILGVMQRACT